jgi:hypothetical protein
MRHRCTPIALAICTAALLVGCGNDGNSPVRVDQQSGAPPVPFVWSWLNPLPQGNHLNSVAVSGSRAVAVGEDGVIVVGRPGTTNWHDAAGRLGRALRRLGPGPLRTLSVYGVAPGRSGRIESPVHRVGRPRRTVV